MFQVTTTCAKIDLLQCGIVLRLNFLTGSGFNQLNIRSSIDCEFYNTTELSQQNSQFLSDLSGSKAVHSAQTIRIAFPVFFLFLA